MYGFVEGDDASEDEVGTQVVNQLPPVLPNPVHQAWCLQPEPSSICGL